MPTSWFAVIMTLIYTIFVWVIFTFAVPQKAQGMEVEGPEWDSPFAQEVKQMIRQDYPELHLDLITEPNPVRNQADVRRLRTAYQNCVDASTLVTLYGVWLWEGIPKETIRSKFFDDTDPYAMAIATAVLEDAVRISVDYSEREDALRTAKIYRDVYYSICINESHRRFHHVAL